MRSVGERLLIDQMDRIATVLSPEAVLLYEHNSWTAE